MAAIVQIVGANLNVEAFAPHRGIAPEGEEEEVRAGNGNMMMGWSRERAGCQELDGQTEERKAKEGTHGRKRSED